MNGVLGLALALALALQASVIQWSPDRIAIIEYVEARDQVVVTYSLLKDAQSELERFQSAPNPSAQDQRHIAALTQAVGIYLGNQVQAEPCKDSPQRCETLRGRRLPLQRFR